MKRLFSILLAAIMLASVAPSVITGEDAASLAVDSAAPAKVVGNEIILNDTVSSAELLSYFSDKSGLTVKSADGTELTLADKVSAGATVNAGDKSLTVAVYGDVNRDGNINARDIIETMRGMAAGTALSAAADVDASGNTDAKDIMSVMRSLVGYNEQFGENRRYNEAGSDAVTLYFDSLMHRIGRRDTTIYGDTTGLIRMAKNELEDAQLMIVTSEKLDDVTVEIGEMKNDAGDVLETTLYDMYTWEQTIFKQLVVQNLQASYNQETDDFCEPLPKLVGTLNFGKNESHGVMIQVRTTPESKAGYYSADVVLRDKSGNELKRTVLRTLVWDVTLDDETASDTAFGVSWGDTLTRPHKNKENFLEIVNSPEFAANRPVVYREYMQFLMDNRISPYTLPFDILTSDADEYMSNPRVTSFCTLGGGQHSGDPYSANANADTVVPEIYKKLRTNEDWLYKAYVYLVDEPSGEHGVRLSENVYNYMSSVVPEKDFHIVVPMAGNGHFMDNGEFVDYVEYTAKYTDIMCPQSYAFTPYYTRQERREAAQKGIVLFPPGSYMDRWTYDENYTAFGNKQFQQRYDELGESGQRKWWYICCAPEIPHPNYFRCYQGAAQRVTLWQQYMFHSDGLLYWAMQDGWDKISAKRPTPNSGDGLLMYWGELFGQSGPVSSIRLEYIRDGIEDFQYMKQLEAYVDRDEIIKTYVNKVTTEILRYSEDYRDIESVRVDLGFMLEELSK